MYFNRYQTQKTYFPDGSNKLDIILLCYSKNNCQVHVIYQIPQGLCPEAHQDTPIYHISLIQFKL